MSDTRHHRAPTPRFPHGSPARYRRALVRLYRSRMRRLLRAGRWDELGPPKRDASWYW